MFPKKSPGSKQPAKKSPPFAFGAAKKGKNIPGLPTFQHGKNAGRSMVLRG